MLLVVKVPIGFTHGAHWLYQEIRSKKSVEQYTSKKTFADPTGRVSYHSPFAIYNFLREKARRSNLSYIIAKCSEQLMRTIFANSRLALSI